VRSSPRCGSLEQGKSSCTEVQLTILTIQERSRQLQLWRSFFSWLPQNTLGHLILAWGVKMKLLKWHSCVVPYHVNSGKPVGPMLLECFFFFLIFYARFNMQVREKSSWLSCFWINVDCHWSRNKTSVLPGSCPRYISNHHWLTFLYVFKTKIMNSKLDCLNAHFYFYLEF